MKKDEVDILAMFEHYAEHVEDSADPISAGPLVVAECVQEAGERIKEGLDELKDEVRNQRLPLLMDELSKAIAHGLACVMFELRGMNTVLAHIEEVLDK